jgi:hypothetical protein
MVAAAFLMVVARPSPIVASQHPAPWRPFASGLSMSIQLSTPGVVWIPDTPTPFRNKEKQFSTL